MRIEPNIPLLESILEPWRERIGKDYPGYRNHAYRMLHYCLALHACSEDERRKLVIAAAFHDIGLWSAATVDYLPPSIEEASGYLRQHGLESWIEEIGLMIDMHHKLKPYTDPRFPLVEVFRQGDLVDFSLGTFRCGLPKAVVDEVKAAFPNAGFHAFLLRGAWAWFSRHPLRMPPFMKR